MSENILTQFAAKELIERNGKFFVEKEPKPLRMLQVGKACTLEGAAGPIGLGPQDMQPTDWLVECETGEIVFITGSVQSGKYRKHRVSRKK